MFCVNLFAVKQLNNSPTQRFRTSERSRDNCVYNHELFLEPPWSVCLFSHPLFPLPSSPWSFVFIHFHLLSPCVSYSLLWVPPHPCLTWQAVLLLFHPRSSLSAIPQFCFLPVPFPLTAAGWFYAAVSLAEWHLFPCSKINPTDHETQRLPFNAHIRHFSNWWWPGSLLLSVSGSELGNNQRLPEVLV